MPCQTTAKELFERTEELLRTPARIVNQRMHETLVLTCAAGLSNSRHAFGNLASQVDTLCRLQGLSRHDTADIQHMRHDSNTTRLLSPEDLGYDCRALCTLISAVFDTDVPAALTRQLPHHCRPRQEGKMPSLRVAYIRGIVRTWDEDTITLATEQEGWPPLLTIDYRHTPEYIDLSYLYGLLRVGMQLNILDGEVKGQVVTPRLIVVEPDFLLDISALANCFEDYGHHPLLYLLNRMRPRPNNRHTLMGNFAGQALDDIVNSEAASIGDTLRRNFRAKALEYATCQDLDIEAFKTEAARQVAHIVQVMGDLFEGRDRRQALLEPSFVCERLGLQGRVDLMTQDLRLLVEQKSGRNIYVERQLRNRHGSLHVEKHYVQVLLYFGVLQYSFGRRADIRLLYSRYPLPGGLLEVQPLQKLFREAISLRNRIVASEYTMAQEGVEDALRQLSPETLNTEQMDNFFYHTYLRPQLEEAISPLRQLSPIAHEYFCRMMRFVLKEQILQKTGGSEGDGNAGADLWNMPLSSKRETGNIYTGLTITDKEKSMGTGGYDLITLKVPRQSDDFLPNFRRGDMIYLYAYREGEEPDVRRAILYKGCIAQIHADRLTIHLNDGQQNEQALGQGPYAIEHGSSDIATTAAISGLYSLITANPERQALLLGQRKPRHDGQRSLTRSYCSTYDNILLHAQQALDYFLLVGPPGTGKTSMALRFLVEEELHAHPQSSLLLMAYTNRAVDEICAMLKKANIDFIRIGSEFSCDGQYKEHLLSEVVARQPRLDALRKRLENASVIVGTTSTLSARPFILEQKAFSLTIVDEASQILEPQLIGLLARTGRFILIGDYKQLPAVVQQPTSESVVDSPLLHAICMDDCRHSLFERLIRWEQRNGRTQFVGILDHQGRMHPDVAEWPGLTFYQEERIQPVPCPHQQEKLIPYPADAHSDALDRLLQEHRMVFIASQYCRRPDLSDKVNTDEAHITATILLRLYHFYGSRFDAHQSVGIIVPYRNQIAMIRREIDQLGLPALRNVSIDTVERYQGSQRDVIIYSFTIQRRSQLDFLTANSFEENGRIIDRKLNVALTRARCQMIMTGNEPVLRHHPLFGQLIDYVKQKGGYMPAQKFPSHPQKDENLLADT